MEAFFRISGSTVFNGNTIFKHKVSMKRVSPRKMKMETRRHRVLILRDSVSPWLAFLYFHIRTQRSRGKIACKIYAFFLLCVLPWRCPPSRSIPEAKRSGRAGVCPSWLGFFPLITGEPYFFNPPHTAHIPPARSPAGWPSLPPRAPRRDALSYRADSEPVRRVASWRRSSRPRPATFRA